MCPSNTAVASPAVVNMLHWMRKQIGKIGSFVILEMKHLTKIRSELNSHEKETSFLRVLINSWIKARGQRGPDKFIREERREELRKRRYFLKTPTMSAVQEHELLMLSFWKYIFYTRTHFYMKSPIFKCWPHIKFQILSCANVTNLCTEISLTCRQLTVFFLQHSFPVPELFSNV